MSEDTSGNPVPASIATFVYVIIPFGLCFLLALETLGGLSTPIHFLTSPFLDGGDHGHHVEAPAKEDEAH